MKKDMEAFARRASVNALAQMTYNCNGSTPGLFEGHTEEIHKLMTSSIYDLDWQVKIEALKFWEKFVEKHLISFDDGPNMMATDATQDFTKKRKLEDDANLVKEKVEILSKCGLVEVLFVAKEDCDKLVQQKALEMLKVLKAIFGKSGNCEQCETKISKFELEINTGISLNYFKENFLHILEDMDTDKLLENASKSTDSYENNLESLVDDILISMDANIDEDVDSNSASVDCY